MRFGGVETSSNSIASGSTKQESFSMREREDCFAQATKERMSKDIKMKKDIK
jgi:hypothetical protein